MKLSFYILLLSVSCFVLLEGSAESEVPEESAVYPSNVYIEELETENRASRMKEEMEEAARRRSTRGRPLPPCKKSYGDKCSVYTEAHNICCHSTCKCDYWWPFSGECLCRHYDWKPTK